MDSSNKLLQEWGDNFGFPPFEKINYRDFESAFNISMKSHLLDLENIVACKEEPNFQNTIETLDRAGNQLSRVTALFFNLCSSVGTPELQKIELKFSPLLAVHENKSFTFPGLFDRFCKVYNQKDSLNLSTEQMRLMERLNIDFINAGAKFSPENQAQYAKISSELAELNTLFSQNLLMDESEVFVALDRSKDELQGLPDDIIIAAEEAAKTRNVDHDHIITLSRSFVEPFLTFSPKRHLREKVWKLWTSRGYLLGDKRDNRKLIPKILALRQQQAELHGYTSYAHFSSNDSMAKTPEKILELVQKVWGPAKMSFEKEKELLEKYVKNNHMDSDFLSENGSIKIEPWDWRFLAEKVRVANYNLENSEVKPYFSLKHMVGALFDCARQLFDLEFKLRPDLKGYHEDVKVYEVFETTKNGDKQESKFVAFFMHDNYSRSFKSSGAWMSEYQTQNKNSGDFPVIPIVVNNNNFNKGKDESSTLLTFDDAVTLFHEFGHGLHGMLSDVNYRRLAGTAVLKDFLELPSQLFEHFISQPVVLKKHALHYLTNEPIPDHLISKIKSAREFNQGFATVEYASCVLVDMAIHLNTNFEDFDIIDFEEKELKRIEMPDGIIMRHRPPHFQHLFSGNSYASGYYVYLWAEVLDADCFEAFEEAGDCFDREIAKKLRKFIYSKGNSIDPEEAFRLFRGRDPKITPMLKKRGLI